MTDASLFSTASPGSHDQTLREPVAIVGIACITPSAQDTESFWRLLEQGEHAPLRAMPAHRIPQTSAAARAHLDAWRGSFFTEAESDFKRFRIPPAYRKSVSQMMLLQLRAAEQCLRDAGYPDKLPSLDDTDVYSGACFCFDSALNNALKVEGVRLAYEAAEQRSGDCEADLDAIRERLRDHFGLSSHDRVGEMASSIPARIASHFGFRGRAQALESADATSYVVLEAALLALSGGQTKAALVIAGQRYDSLLPALALEKKGFASGAPFTANSPGAPLAEGATALLLKKLSDARRDGDRIYSVIRGAASARRDSPSGYRYGGDAALKYQAAAEACRQANIDPARQGYIECALPGHVEESKALLTALSDLRHDDNVSLRLRSCVANLGYAFASAGLNAIAAASLALRHSRLPGMPQVDGQELLLRQNIDYGAGRSEPWPQTDERIAGVCGGGLSGVSWHLVLSSPDAVSADVETIPASQEPIAIVGVGGSFGPWRDVAAIRASLWDSADGVQLLPESVLPRRAFFSADASRPLSCYAQYGAALEQSEFDLSPYKIFPRRAAGMDKAQKLGLQSAAEALADYGLSRKRQRQEAAAVFIASNLNLGRERALSAALHYAQLQTLFAGSPLAAYFQDASEKQQLSPEEVDHFTLDSFSASGIAALISNCFQLNAAPAAVEAACASSLAALHNAVLALRSHRYDLVLAGGVELPVNIRDLTLCSAQMMLSQHKIAPFAVDADGFSPGDGAGMFVLKRLSDALRDGDSIYAAITGVGASCDARSMTAPDPQGQALAMRKAFVQAGYSPARVEYVETHGTGTRLGDIAELTALNEVYQTQERSGSLKVGSIKSNIGHTFAAAGSAGLLKTLLAIRYGDIPATLLRREMNPDLPLAEIPTEPVTALQPWPLGEDARYAAVSSFGTGGVNYHLLLKSVTDTHAAPDDSQYTAN
ncbi:polyketide synthase [Hahella sp. NBU794]|uniref:beta-ketoacyl [acyl carrier protein] synthase domain-containing protein n=1 Tax=Hahella sp. NBU794 TaxID=3422590 RepID=UPI003D6FF448